jgi:hypothetical protein
LFVIPAGNLRLPLPLLVPTRNPKPETEHNPLLLFSFVIPAGNLRFMRSGNAFRGLDQTFLSRVSRSKTGCVIVPGARLGGA